MSRPYDIVLFGASGYTGKLCAEHVAQAFPTNLKWAIAGRSLPKLESLIKEIKALNPDRPDPAIEICSLQPEELDTLAKKTKLIVNCVGPYHLYGTPVVEACVKNGTHYLDVTGESPWVVDLISKYHEPAKKNNAIIIPQCGFESANSDMLVFALVSYVRQKFNAPTANVVGSLDKLNSKPSGGSLLTVLTISSYPLSHLRRTFEPWSFSPKPGPAPRPRSLFERLFGIFKQSTLGTLTTSIAGDTNRTIVERTWGLSEDPKTYGQNFRYGEFMSVRSRLSGIFAHWALSFGMLALFLPGISIILRRFVTQPGSGPDKESTRNDSVEYRAVGTADEDGKGNGREAIATLRYKGSVYVYTAVLVMQAALVLSRDVQQGGGLLTPAMLGERYLEGLRSNGVDIEIESVERGN